MQVVVDSLLTHYEALGTGQTVILLHGWGDSAAGLRALQAALAKKYTVVAVDLPGFGGTQAPATTWGLDDYAQFVAHFMKKIGVSKAVAIVGHSNGGAVAIRGVANDMLRPEKLVLLAAAGIRAHGGLRKLGFKALAKSGKVASIWLPAVHREQARRKVYHSAGSGMLVVPELQAAFKKTVSQDLQADAAKINLPALLLYGEQDTAAPVWYGERYHELMSASTLEILPGAGHFAHLDRPAEVVKAIEEFVG